MNNAISNDLSLPDALGIACQHHNAGRFLEAEVIYRQVLATKTDSAEVYKNHGNTLLSLGRLEEAENAYNKALELKPDYAEAHNNLGNVLRLAGRLEEAEQAFRRALTLLPDRAEVYNNFGNVLLEAGRTEEAEQAYRKAIVLKPDYAMAYANRGNALRALGRLGVAEKSYRKAVTLKPDYVEAYIGLGQALRGLDRLAASEEAYCQALGILPNHPEAYNDLGNVLAKQDRLIEAEDAYRQAIAIKPDYAEAYNGLGNVCSGQARLDEAEHGYRRAIAIKPAYVEAYIGLGILLTNMRRFEDAEDAYRRALDQKPDFAEAKWNLSFLALTLGRLDEGFRLYEARFSDMKDFDSLESTKNIFKQLSDVKRWAGEPLEGRSILIIMEQGAGDSLMMMRYLPLLKQRGVIRLTVHCYPVLLRVFQSMAAVDEAVSTIEPLPIDRLDFYCPIMSLPYLFGTRLESIPGNVPYLSAPDNIKRKWRTRLKKATGLNVGLAWAGNKQNVKDRERSIPLLKFQPLTEIEGVQLVSLQKGEAAGQLQEAGWDIPDWMEMCDDFLDTAALVAELDLVISVDTSVAHLAGALGKPVWLLNRFESEWRWMLDREDSPWYPTMKIFRQKAKDDWESVISLVAEELARLAAIPGARIIAPRRPPSREPESAETHKNQGNALLSLGRLDEAEQAYRRALALNPDFAAAHNNLGNVLRLSGRLEEAEQAFRRALALLPDSAEVHNNFGNVLMDAGRAEEAEKAYRRAVVLKPDYAMGYVNHGNALRVLERFGTAEKSYRKAIALKPDYVEAHYGLGVILERSGRSGDAEQAYRRALALKPDHVEAHLGLACALVHSERFDEAEHAYRQAIVLKPDYPEAYYGLGYALRCLGRFEEEAEVYRYALTFRPDYAEALYALGYALQRLGNIEEAGQAYIRALTVKQDHAEAYSGLGNVLLDLGRIEEAEQAYLKALDLKPEYTTAGYNLSLLRLLQGLYEEGFELYEQRFDVYNMESSGRIKALTEQLQGCKRWQGEPLHGSSLLAIAEQGAGDCLMMMRYLSLLRQREPKRLVVYCYPPLKRLYQSMPEVDDVVPMTEPLPIERFDFYCPMMSLPRLFRTRLESIPGNAPYLSVPDNMRRKWRTRLKKATGLNVGLAWAGNKQNVKDRERSIPLLKFQPLTEIEGVQLVSLQKGEAAGQLQEAGWDIPDWMEMCDDYMDTAALVAELDLVISVDTSVAHLAGALGKQVWLLNRFESEWRWMLDREDSPWYSTMKIFRQGERGDWERVISHVAEELFNLSRAMA